MPEAEGDDECDHVGAPLQKVAQEGALRPRGRAATAVSAAPGCTRKEWTSLCVGAALGDVLDDGLRRPGGSSSARQEWDEVQRHTERPEEESDAEPHHQHALRSKAQAPEAEDLRAPPVASACILSLRPAPRCRPALGGPRGGCEAGSTRQESQQPGGGGVALLGLL